jgi:hypothetical protein
VSHVDAGHHLEQLARYVVRASGAGRRHVDLARIGLGVGNELGNRIGRNRWMNHHNAGSSHEARNRSDVADKIEIQLIVKCHVDRVRHTEQQERIAIWRRAHDGLGADVAAAARPVLDDERLAKSLRELLTDQSCHDVECAAGCEADDQAHRPRRVAFRPSDPGHGRQRGSARGQIQKLSSVGEFHGVLSLESTRRHKYIALATISQEFAALRDFDPVYVGSGSSSDYASNVPMSALPATDMPLHRLQSESCRFCCKSLFALVIKISFGCTRDFRVKMWGTSLPEDKFAGDLGNVIEATSIGGCRSDFLTAGKLAPGNLGLLQQYLPGPDSCSAAKDRLLDHLVGAAHERNWDG